MKGQIHISRLVHEIQSFFQENADAAQAERYARYFTEGYDAYGLTRERFESFLHSFWERDCERMGVNDVLNLGDRLMKSGKYEEASLAILSLKPFASQFDGEILGRIRAWLDEGIRNWAHTDVLCGEILSIFFIQDVIGMEDLSLWRESKSKWTRRAVPVALLTLLKQKKKVESLLSFIEPLMLDEEKMVQQGLGWFLREAWKRDPVPVEALLGKWKDRAPRKIYQYATEKMSKEQKERFRRGKKNPS